MIGLALAVLARRLAAALPILAVVSAMIFVILRLLPADPVAMSLPPNATEADHAALRAAFALDRPVPEQYALWLGRLMGGDFGRSIHLHQDVGQLIGTALPATLELVVAGFLVGAVLGVGGGVVLFALRGGPGEAVADLGSTVLQSIPDFLWSLLLILGAGVALQLLPFVGRISPDLSVPTVTGFMTIDAALTGRAALLISVLGHMVLPSLALGLGFAPLVMRVVRASLLDVIEEDFIAAARLRGLGETRVLIAHALRNAALPTLSLLGVQTTFLFGGTLLVEVIFGYPGLGNLMVLAVHTQDLPVIQAVALTYCVAVLAINVTVDILALALNPKLRPA